MQTDDRGVSLWCEETDEDYRDQAALGMGAPGVQLRAAWDPSVSGGRVIQRLLHVEERYAPSPLYVGLIQQEPQRREELAKWTLEVCCDCGCDEAVFPLSVSLMDRFLSVTLSTPVSPYCLAAACVLIASKLSECDNITSNALCAAAEYNFLPANLREMERVVLATLRWDTAAVTPQDFLPHFLASLGERNEEDSTTLRRHSDTLATLCACDSRFLGASPSLVAAASLNCALRGLGDREHSRLHPLSSTLADLCQADPVVLQYYSEMIEHALRQRLSSRPAVKGDEFEDERAGTPTDMREIDF
ncbi:cyclin Dx isoform X1 [Syngnathus acus]|uniref:cyclin Dx isoform X1 n=2 Tax=Syngnathus acus TaxID=161584 RepID=UPI001885EB53|nr:cyclin Dx isoform X1 [Syngnathus acus]